MQPLRTATSGAAWHHPEQDRPGRMNDNAHWSRRPSIRQKISTQEIDHDEQYAGAVHLHWFHTTTLTFGLKLLPPVIVARQQRLQSCVNKAVQDPGPPSASVCSAISRASQPRCRGTSRVSSFVLPRSSWTALRFPVRRNQGRLDAGRVRSGPSRIKADLFDPVVHYTSVLRVPGAGMRAAARNK